MPPINFTHYIIENSKITGKAVINYTFNGKSYCYYKNNEDEEIKESFILNKTLIPIKIYNYLKSERIP